MMKPRGFPGVASYQGATAFNRKIIDIAQQNLNSVFDLAKSLAGAKNLSDIVELQANYWRKQFDTLAAQAEEVRAHYRLRWLLMQQSQSKAAFIK